MNKELKNLKGELKRLKALQETQGQQVLKADTYSKLTEALEKFRETTHQIASVKIRIKFLKNN